MYLYTIKWHLVVGWIRPNAFPYIDSDVKRAEKVNMKAGVHNYYHRHIQRSRTLWNDANAKERRYI